MLHPEPAHAALQAEISKEGAEAALSPDALATLSLVGAEAPEKVVQAEFGGSKLTIAQHGENYIELRAEVGSGEPPPPLLSDSAIAEVLSEYLRQPDSGAADPAPEVQIFTSVDTNWPRRPRSKE